MATETAGAPAAAPPPAVDTAAQRAAWGEAPVKLEFVRSVGARVHVGAVSGGRLQATQAMPNVEAQPKAVQGKSKKQAKKVRQVAAAWAPPAGAQLASRTSYVDRAAWAWRGKRSCQTIPSCLPTWPACRTAHSTGSAPLSSAQCLRWVNAPTAIRAGEEGGLC